MDWLGLGLGLLGSFSSHKAQRQEAIAQGRQMAEQATNAITTMNYAFQNYEQERRDAFESAVANLERIQLNSKGLQGSVDNAVSEELGDSKTGRLISRATHAETLRASLSEKDNYVRKSNEVDLNKEQQLVSTKAYTSGLHPPKLPSKTSMFLDMAQVGLNFYSQHRATEAFKQSHYGQTAKRNSRVVTYGKDPNAGRISVVRRDNVTYGQDPNAGRIKVVRR
ncbi:hypothetical protein [uncultured Veillonella sp.]|uniref:virion core protein, T7 gp14 family n=1 Tax=uncultured Veillonella sp. TaxID=159268 RepID=UPI0025EF4281|nr:hypothetical protein [uncultured Veillonella sp.]